MRIGVPKEIKDHEYRVGMTPASVQALVDRGHSVLVQQEAGAGAGFSDEQYRGAGAILAVSAEEVFESSEMIVKVKEPQLEECMRLRVGQLIFAYLHLAPDPKQTELLLYSGCIAIAYETITNERGGLPLLTPSSEVAGRLSVQAGAHCLEKMQGGHGTLLGSVGGVPPGKVVVIGGGVAGTQALHVAVGMGAEVTVLEKSEKRIEKLKALFAGKVKTLPATPETLAEQVVQADLAIGSVLVPGASAPKLVSRALVRQMRPGSVVVDIAIDQGGCFETSRPTTFSHPTFVEEGVVHYCVVNMPGGVPRTSTIALNQATLPFIIDLADKGARDACLQNPHLLQGLNICQGQLTYQAVALALDRPFTPPTVALG